MKYGTPSREDQEQSHGGRNFGSLKNDPYSKGGCGPVPYIQLII